MLVKTLKDYSTQNNEVYAIVLVVFAFSCVLHMDTIKSVLIQCSILVSFLITIFVKYYFISNLLAL